MSDMVGAVPGSNRVAVAGEKGRELMTNLVAFRITNFRSIVDSRWCSFSPDGATVIVGQNESGKSSILEALSKTFSQENITDDDCRIDAELPAVFLRIRVARKRLLEILHEYPEEQLSALASFLAQQNDVLTIGFHWSHVAGKERYSCDMRCEDEQLGKLLAAYHPEAGASGRASQEESHDTDAEETEQTVEKPAPYLTLFALGAAIYDQGPATVLFDQASGLLPDCVDIQSKSSVWVLVGNGSIAASNFLKIGGVKLSDLVGGSPRSRQTMLARANAAVTEDFRKFWSQTIGKNEKLELKCEFANYGSAAPNPGAPHLEFWITDGLNQLFPKQRSLGVRWFVSFYLQLKASEKDGDGTVFLLDEPGANLHAKAQADVLKLINQLGSSAKCQIVYSTHSPHMIEYDKLHRIIAAQREGEADNTPTKLIHAHELGAASRDTLSPVLTAMGVDLSHQQVVQKRNNVILEEISGFYYLTAFWKLMGEKQEAYFIAASGAGNVEPLANMFLGWGLEFIVAVDDDGAGRQAYNSLKRHMFGDDDRTAHARMLKMGGDGIEDVFSTKDFCRYVLGEPDTRIDGKNSHFVKAGSKAKAILAYQFLNKVNSGEIKFTAFEQDTKSNIKTIVRDLVSRLQGKPTS